MTDSAEVSRSELWVKALSSVIWDLVLKFDKHEGSLNSPPRMQLTGLLLDIRDLYLVLSCKVFLPC